MATLRACEDLEKILADATQDLRDEQEVLWKKRNDMIIAGQQDYSELEETERVKKINEALNEVLALDAKRVNELGEQEIEINIPDNFKSFAKDNWQVIVDCFPKIAGRKNLLAIGKLLEVE